MKKAVLSWGGRRQIKGHSHMERLTSGKRCENVKKGLGYENGLPVGYRTDGCEKVSGPYYYSKQLFIFSPFINFFQLRLAKSTNRNLSGRWRDSVYWNKVLSSRKT